jgi:hypothetical protein
VEGVEDWNTVRVEVMHAVCDREMEEEPEDVATSLDVADCDAHPEVDLENKGEGDTEIVVHSEALIEAVAQFDMLRV